MNLIEQLGGYERAKAFLNAASYTMDELIMMQRSGVRPQHVEKALLEYRRQHSTFEVGDKVKAKDHQFGFDELFRIDDFFANDDGVNLAVLDDGDCYPISFLEHATDAEIKAGKRLEVT